MSDRRSRYARSTAVTWSDATGDALVLWELRDIPMVPAIYAHSLVEGERLDHLAYRYYRDATKFWRITDGADALDPNDLLLPGQPVRVPPDR